MDVQKWRRGVAVLAVALAFGVAACDPGEDPTNPPTSETSDESSSPSESPSSEEPAETTTTAGPPEIDPPEPPEGMFVDDHQGAILAASYFLDLYSYMRTTGDTRQFEAMSGPDCEFCSTSITSTEELHGNGNWIEGGELVHDVDEMTAELPNAERPEYVVHVQATEQPFTVHYSDGTSERAEEPVELLMAIGVRYVNDRFIVLGVTYEER